MNQNGASSANLIDIFRHALITLAFCIVIAVMLTLMGRGAWDVQLVYSISIGMISFTVIDGAWWVVARGEGKFWRHGWRGPALILFGTAVGFVAGTAIGDAYSGGSIWQLWARAPTQVVSIIVTSLVATIVVAYYFYSRGTAKSLEAQVATAERDASEAKLKLLETQLEPHMLFNTLANLRVLITTDAPRAVAMLDRLNSYLRATLSGSRAVSHPLCKEFALLDDYLALMSVRMGERLRYTLELPDALRDAAVPPLLLQPLVENAIQHGLEPKVGGGSIKVRASQRAGIGNGDAPTLVIDVVDTGVGFAPQDRTLDEPGRGFGLTQIRERLTGAYGARGTIAIDTDAATGGTRATVAMPLSNAS